MLASSFSSHHFQPSYTTTSKNLSSRLQPLGNKCSFVRSLLWISVLLFVASHKCLSFCLQPPMSGCPQSCSLLWPVVSCHQPLSWMVVLADADFMNACLPVSLMNGRPPVCSLSQVVVYCICLQPLMIKVLLSAASHDWLSCCLQPLIKAVLLYLQPLMDGCPPACNL